MNTMVGRWAPKLERSRISAAIFSGSPIGTVVSLSVSGWLCGMDFLGGWPAAFYVFAFDQVSEFDRGRIVAYRDCGLSFRKSVVVLDETKQL
ncbi:hypothetical protein TNCV_1405501 [Trichonephila clavipes]|nr:hypothetical protein TNCV_1405501 [Trichonephila clavipes]